MVNAIIYILNQYYFLLLRNNVRLKRNPFAYILYTKIKVEDINFKKVPTKGVHFLNRVVELCFAAMASYTQW